MLSLSVFPLPIRFLSSASLPVPATWPSVSSFPLLPRFASQLLFRCCLSVFRLPCFSTSVPPGFPCFPSDSSYSASCSFLFILPGFAPTAVPPVLPFRSHFRAFPSLPFSFVHFRSGSDYSASVCSFPLSSPPRLSAASQVLPLCLSTSLLFPVLSDLVSYVLFPGSSYSAFCLFPFILP